MNLSNLNGLFNCEIFSRYILTIQVGKVSRVIPGENDVRHFSETLWSSFTEKKKGKSVIRH